MNCFNDIERKQIIHPNVWLWFFKWVHMHATAVVQPLPHIAMEIINYICIIGLWLFNYCYIQSFFALSMFKIK